MMVDLYKIMDTDLMLKFFINFGKKKQEFFNETYGLKENIPHY